MQSMYGFNGEVLRKREITYIFSNGTPGDLIKNGYQLITDHNGELAIKKNGIVHAIGETGLSIGGINIKRELGGIQRKDIEAGKTQLNNG